MASSLTAILMATESSMGQDDEDVMLKSGKVVPVFVTVLTLHSLLA